MAGKLILVGAWYKRNAHPGNPSSPHYSLEFYVGKAMSTGFSFGAIPDHIDVPQDFGGAVSRGERIRNKDGSNAHPTQKPIEVMKQLCGNADTILDPFMGSGTTLRAAKDLGRKAIGIEIEERYCEIAANRMAQGVLL